jgi:hypothetical protein
MDCGPHEFRATHEGKQGWLGFMRIGEGCRAGGRSPMRTIIRADLTPAISVAVLDSGGPLSMMRPTFRFLI